ncbi:TetR family transcriptional regulator [Paractinoplanes ferrugineus]|uniref:TetR family transcriptional regulator n=1 Tax=Paractinoplanes ferrugineus TaxID=113564 RepID=A0A919IZ15_9ACTN|nr:TetR/AcrR family transcriptional regulator [Actinoplanes ferrugineus]GIE10838.1 TetR family transcriptional regulator [Actinoplanes ferrugineus]
MTTSTPRRRDAEETRRRLLEAARRRFSEDGYAATTVRDIADDAGVNVALINRYFASKEGLFEACLRHAGEELRRSAGDVPLAGIAGRIAEQMTGAAEVPAQLSLLLRTSGDERADEIRRAVLLSSAEKIAAAAGRPDSDRTLLRAELLLATTIGLALLRWTTPIEPLASAGADDLAEPLGDVVEALLGAR